MNLRETLLQLDKLSHDWLCEVSPEVCSNILRSDIYNDIPTNIGQLPEKVLRYFPKAKFQVGNEKSRVVYVSDYSGVTTEAQFAATMQGIGEVFHASENNSDDPLLGLKWRFWWD